jgi:hypothetical protein
MRQDHLKLPGRITLFSQGLLPLCPKLNFRGENLSGLPSGIAVFVIMIHLE